jgi:tripartite-type tricarboxylate transporter receptor subunit TctC
LLKDLLRHWGGPLIIGEIIMTRIARRTFTAGLLAAAVPFATAQAQTQVQASSFPAKPVTIVLGYPPGGPTDLYARALAQGLSTLWGQSVVVENKGGASGSIGAMQVLRAPADGYTLFFSNNATNGAYEQLNPNAPYRTLRDFAPVALFGVVPNLLVVRANLPAKNLAELVALAKTKPDAVSYATSAIGSAPHLASEIFAGIAGVKLLHVPYGGAGPLMTSIIGGNVDMYIGGPSTVLDHVKSGKLRALAALSKHRLKMAPDVPTMEEQGFKGAEYESWFGLLASANVPPALLDRINADCIKVMTTPAIKEKLDLFAVEYFPADRAQFRGVLQDEIDRAGKVIREKKMTAE